MNKNVSRDATKAAAIAARCHRMLAGQGADVQGAVIGEFAALTQIVKAIS